MRNTINSLGRQIDSMGRKFYLILGVALIVISINIIPLGLFMTIFGISEKEDFSIILGVIFLITGITIAIVGIVMLFMHKSEEKKKRHGFFIDTTVAGYYVDYKRWGRNFRHPYILVCRHFLENGQYQEYISEPIWFDPNYYLGRTVRVFSNSPNFFPYYVDLDSIPI